MEKKTYSSRRTKLCAYLKEKVRQSPYDNTADVVGYAIYKSYQLLPNVKKLTRKTILLDILKYYYDQPLVDEKEKEHISFLLNDLVELGLTVVQYPGTFKRLLNTLRAMLKSREIERKNKEQKE